MKYVYEPPVARHRLKGNRVEREIVAAHLAIGIKAERIPMSGAARFRGDGHDVTVYCPDAIRCEVKARKNGAGFKQLEDWLADNDVLFLRRNHADPMVVLPWRLWARLLQREVGTNST
jgi:Holliday junction resolvase